MDSSSSSRPAKPGRVIGNCLDWRTGEDEHAYAGHLQWSISSLLVAQTGALRYRYWIKYLSDSTELKNKPKLILEKLGDLIDGKVALLKRAKTDQDRADGENRQLKEKLQKLEVSMRQLQAELAARQSAKRPQSSTDMLPASRRTGNRTCSAAAQEEDSVERKATVLPTVPSAPDPFFVTQGRDSLAEFM